MSARALLNRKSMAQAFSNQYGWSSGASYVLCDLARECQRAIEAKIEIMFTAPIGARRDMALSQIDIEIKNLFFCAAAVCHFDDAEECARLLAFHRFIATVELCAVNWALRCYKGRRLP